MIDLTPDMEAALSRIGGRSTTCTELGVGSSSMKRLYEMGFLKIDMPSELRFPAHYSLTPMGQGAAAMLNRELPVPENYESPLARIKRMTAAHFMIPAEEMVSARRAKKVARPRQVAMYLSRKLTPKSLPDIGRNFGGRDHTTVMHAIRTVERLMEQDHNFKDDVTTLFRAFGSAEAIKPVNRSREAVADELAVGA